MKRLILILALLSSPAWATWTLVQNKVNASCTTSSTTCVVTVTATGAGNVLLVTAQFNANRKIASVSDGTSTYSLCPSSECFASNGSNRFIDMAYSLSSTAGKTSITVTRSGTGTNAWICRVYEFSFTNGPAVYDKGGNAFDNTNCTSCAGVTLALTGSNDLILQAISGSSPTAVSGSYNGNGTFSGNNAWAYAVNTNSGTGPTWTQSLATAVVDGIAIKETPPASTCHSFITLLGVGCK